MGCARRSVQASQRSAASVSLRLADRDDAGLPRLQRPVADGAPYGVDLMVDVNHVALLRRCRFPRAISVASASGVAKAAESGEPLVDIPQSCSVDGIQPSLAFRAHRRETIVPQHFQVLRYRRLADVELRLDGGADGARGQFAVGEQFEDAPADRVAEDVKRVHHTDIKRYYLYKSSL